MSESSGEKCAEEQRKVLESVLGFMNWAPEMEKKINEAYALAVENQRQIIEIDKKHTEAFDSIEKTLNAKFDSVVDLVANQGKLLKILPELQKSIKAMQASIDQVQPYIDTVKPVNDLWIKWRPRVIKLGVASIIWVLASILKPELSPAALSTILSKLL